MSKNQQEWAKALFAKSVLKQEKWRRIKALLPELAGQDCLDIGADNGVISLLLREMGGNWKSADLEPVTVESIRSLVGDEVYQISGEATPFEDQVFDLVVIVDFLEHTHTDREFADDLKRILKPGGQLIVNVPHLKPYSILNRLRRMIGLTDEKHGHVRPGYTEAGLVSLLGDDFAVQFMRTYSKTFSEFIDTGLNFLYEVLQKKKNKNAHTAKGAVVTKDDLAQHAKQFKLLSMLYPVLWVVAKLDSLLFWLKGYKLIISARYQGKGTQ